MVTAVDRLRAQIGNTVDYIENAATYVGREIVVIPHNIARGTSYAVRSTAYMANSTPENFEKLLKLSGNICDLTGLTGVSGYIRVMVDFICARNAAGAYLKLKNGYNRMTRGEVIKTVALGGAGVCEAGRWLMTYAKVDLPGIASSIGQTRLMTAVGGDKAISFVLQFSITVTKNSLVMFASTISVGQATLKIYNNGFTVKESLEILTNSLKISVIIMSGGAAAIFVVYAVDVTSTVFKVSVFALNSLSYIKVLYDTPVGAF